MRTLHASNSIHHLQEHHEALIVQRATIVHVLNSVWGESRLTCNAPSHQKHLANEVYINRSRRKFEHRVIQQNPPPAVLFDFCKCSPNTVRATLHQTTGDHLSFCTLNKCCIRIQFLLRQQPLYIIHMYLDLLYFADTLLHQLS